MKNSEIHSRFEKAVIRDFFSTQLKTIWLEESSLRKEEIPYDRPHSLEWSIADADAWVEFWKKMVTVKKQRLAVVKLIEMMGWKEFDVCEYVDNDLNGYISFIGTDLEFDMLKNVIKTSNI